jgi:hypothetical protein
MTNVEKWEVALIKMKANRLGTSRVIKHQAVEDELVAEMEVLFSEMTPAERDSVERPEPPTQRSLIAHNSQGQLIGYEDHD